MTDFISAGTKLVCPTCKRLQIFERSIPEESLPFTLKCSTEGCGWNLTYSKEDVKPAFPKIDPINRVHGNWVIELQQARDRGGKDYWQPGAQQQSFRESCNTIATHLAGGLQVIEKLRGELLQLADAMTEQFEAEWGMHVSFLRNWNPGRVATWIKQPFCAFPIACQDSFLPPRSRLFIHPSFFTPVVGFPLKSHGDFYAQLVTPYTLIEFPLETWLRNVLGITPIPELHVSSNRIIGRDLFHCWRDIPGTVPDVDHHDDAPLLKIVDNLQARTWLARLGITPWNIGPLTQEHAFKALWTYYLGGTATKDWGVDIFHKFVKYGRLAMFFANPAEAWELALTFGSFMYGQKLVLIPTPELKQRYQGLHREASFVKANTSFHWKVVNDTACLDEIDWQSLSYLIVDYSEDFPPEALERLYQFQGRLILIGQNAVMDTMESNWEASRFYGLVAKTIWHPDLPGLHTAFDYSKGQDSIVAAILSNWHDNSRITKGKLQV